MTVCWAGGWKRHGLLIHRGVAEHTRLAPGVLPGMSRSWSPPVPAPSPVCRGLCKGCSHVQALTFLLPPQPLPGELFLWYTFGSTKHSRLQGCDSVVWALTSSHLLLPSTPGPGLIGCPVALSTFCFYLSTSPPQQPSHALSPILIPTRKEGR